MRRAWAKHRGAPAVLALLSLSCSRGPFDGTTYRDGDLNFRVGPTPEAWRSIAADPALIAYRDEASAATIMVGGRCNKDGDDVPLEALTHHLFLHFTERELLTQELLPMAGREALRTELVAKLDGVPQHFVAFVLKKDGCVYDFVRIAPARHGAPTQSADFERFVSGFRTQ